VVKEGGEEEETVLPDVVKKLKTNSNSAKPTKLKNKEQHTDQANNINNNGNSELESSSDFPSKRRRKQSKKAAEAAEAQNLHLVSTTLTSQPVLELPSLPAETESRQQDVIWGDDWPVSEQEGSSG